MRHPEPGAHGLAGLLTEAAELAPAELGSDLHEVRRRGRRRVHLRRAGTAVAGTAVALAVAAGTASAMGALPGTGPSLNVAARGTGEPVPSAETARPPAADPAESSAADPAQPPATAQPGDTSASDPGGSGSADAPIGRLIKTDTAYEGGKLTLWFSRSAQQGDLLQLSLGARDAKGGLRSYGNAFDLDGNELAPGFHQGYNANGQQPRAYALFGYVVGEGVSRVTLVVDGKTRTAKVATWSEDPDVHVWWLLGPTLERWPGKSAPLRGEVSRMTAYAADGTVVVRGEGDIAHG